MNSLKIHILIIEDNSSDALLATHSLKKEGLQCFTYVAETMSRGEEIAKEKPIDIVLLDLTLPDSSKINTLNSFVKSFPDLPVIIMTSASHDDFVERALKSGAQDYLVKGHFDSSLLSRVVRYSLKRHKDQLALRIAERQLTINQAKYQEAERMANFGNWEIDIVSNKMTWTEQVYIIFGLQPNLISPSLSNYLDYVHPDDRSMVHDTFNEAKKDGQLRKIEYRIIVDGTKLKYIANQFKISLGHFSGQPLLVGVVQDITERKMNEMLLAEKNINERNSKIKEDLLEELSFQIRTPLSSIFSFSYLLEEELKGGPQQENLTALRSSVDDLSVSISNLMNFSVLVSEKIKVEEAQFKLEELVNNLKQIMQVKADNKNIKLDFILKEKSLTPYIGDQNKINQMLYNILDNAVKYTPENGQVNVHIEPIEKEGTNTDITFSVKDNGVGIPQPKIKEIMHPNALLNRDGKTGLGIPIAIRLVERMQGTMNIFSKVGEGSEFVMELPIRRMEITEQNIGEKPLRDVNILFVEDHKLNQISTRSILKKWSNKVKITLADNGKLGVEAFENGDFNLILMDLQMPVMNGFDATEAIRAVSQIPIIALSANTNKAEAEKCLEIGINDYLAKPFKPEDLYSCIMKVLYSTNKLDFTSGKILKL